MSAQNDYFSFSKRERTGAICLIVLIVVVFLVPEFIPAYEKTIDAVSYAEISQQIAALKAAESDSLGNKSMTRFKDDYPDHDEPSKEHRSYEPVFEFDPNTLSGPGWKKLGLSDRTIQTIQKYISKGGQFRKPEDIGRIYGLREHQYERLLPFVRIKNVSELKIHKGVEYPKRNMYVHTRKPTPEAIDINLADTTMLIALPGIGSTLANRIIRFRNRLGGFHSVEQMKEIYGLQDSTYQKIKPFIECKLSDMIRININTADAATLQNHPYIKWNIANAIVNFRQQHGEYTSVEGLLKINIISPETLQRLSPYLKVE